MTAAPVVAIGGTLCDDRLWRDCFEQPSPLLVVAGKLPSGAVARSDRMDSYAGELLAALPPRFSLIGFSLGGLIALELAAQAPERIAALALICAGAGPETPEGAVSRRQGEARAAALGMTRHVRQDLLLRYHLGSGVDEAAVEQMAERVGLPLYRRQNDLAISRADSRPRLSGMRFPVRLVAGGDDALCPPARHEEMARLIPEATVTVAEGCGHMVPLEQPESVRTLLDFLTMRPDRRH
ncbi:MAG: alpha/beta fold hydrolase [Rhizobiaceae bacterium]